MRWSDIVKILCLLTIVAMTSYYVFGKRSYGEVSGKAYEIATALYSVCNRQDSNTLSDIEQLLALAQADASLSADEAQMLYGIMQTAQKGDWQRAIHESRALMEDQVKHP